MKGREGTWGPPSRAQYDAPALADTKSLFEWV